MVINLHVCLGLSYFSDEGTNHPVVVPRTWGICTPVTGKQADKEKVRMTYYKTKWWLLLFRLSICNILPLIEDLLLKLLSVTMTVDLCMSALIGTITESGSVFEKVNES